MKTLYKTIEEICARDDIIRKLSTQQQLKFVDFLYEDIKSWDDPTNTTEMEIIHRLGEHISHMVSSILNEAYIGVPYH